MRNLLPMSDLIPTAGLTGLLVALAALLTAFTGFLAWYKPADASGNKPPPSGVRDPENPGPGQAIVPPDPGGPQLRDLKNLPPKPTAPTPPVMDFIGSWINVHEDTRSVHRMALHQLGSDLLLRSWWKCSSPVDCDRSETKVIFLPNSVDLDASRNRSVVKGAFAFPGKQVGFTIYKLNDGMLRLGIGQNNPDEIFERER